MVIEYRWAEGRADRFAEIASEFVRLKVDVIFTYATAAVIAVKQATSVIPIVFAGAANPGSLDPLMNTHRIRINTLALGARLPTLLPFRGFVEAGGLMSYGPNQPVCGGAPPSMSIRYCTGLSQGTSPSSSQPNSIWS